MSKTKNKNGKSQFLVDLSGQGAFRKLAKCPFGSHVVVLRARRGQLGCQVGFKMGLKRPSRAQRCNTKAKMEQTCFKNLTRCEQDLVRWRGNLENSKKTMKSNRFLKARGGPKGAQKSSRDILRDLLVVCRPFLGPSWVHLGLSWALLGPSWGVQEGILRQILGLEGLSWGCKVAND